MDIKTEIPTMLQAPVPKGKVIGSVTYFFERFSNSKISGYRYRDDKRKNISMVSEENFRTLRIKINQLK
ncbi:MAG: hypothetical protein ACLU8S_05860 [Coprococcus phoceensis]